MIFHFALFMETAKYDRDFFDYMFRINSIPFLRYLIILPIAFILFNYVMILRENDDIMLNTYLKWIVNI
jgi:hypothetical protein